jgi:hypothetical protein
MKEKEDHREKKQYVMGVILRDPGKKGFWKVSLFLVGRVSSESVITMKAKLA